MAIEYLGLSSVEGPLVVLEGVQTHSMMNRGIVVDHKTRKWDVCGMNEDKAIIQVLKEPRICPGQYTYEIDGTSDGGYCITGNAWKNL